MHCSPRRPGLSSGRAQVFKGVSGPQGRLPLQAVLAGKGFRLIWERWGENVWFGPSCGCRRVAWECRDGLGSCCLSCRAGARSQSCGGHLKRTTPMLSRGGTAGLLFRARQGPGPGGVREPPQMLMGLCVKWRWPDPSRWWESAGLKLMGRPL